MEPFAAPRAFPKLWRRLGVASLALQDAGGFTGDDPGVLVLLAWAGDSGSVKADLISHVSHVFGFTSA